MTATTTDRRKAATALQALAVNMITEPHDLLCRVRDDAVTMITCNMVHHRRLVGKGGQNIKAMAAVAEWLGITVRLSDWDERVAAKGDSFPVPTGKLDPAFFADLLKGVFVAAGCHVDNVNAEIVEGEELFLAVIASGDNFPSPLVIADLCKLFRAIAIRHGLSEIQMSVE